jgi:hypothetical protein
MVMPTILEGDVERLCDGMPGKPHIQANIMSAVQDVDIERFRLEMMQLPASAQKRMAFTHNGLFSRQWMMECDDVINGPELREIFSIYMVINRVQCVGPGAVAASERRKRARANAYYPYHGMAPLRNQHRYSTRLPSPFSKWGLMAVPELNQ